MNDEVILNKLSKEDSNEYLLKFFKKEEEVYKKSFSNADWHNYDEAEHYIWVLIFNENYEKISIGYIGYDYYKIDNGKEFIYIEKIFVYGEYKKYNNPNLIKLINGKKVSDILFVTIKNEGKDIIVLESACEELDVYYQKVHGFKKNEDIAVAFSDILKNNASEIFYWTKPQKKFDKAKEADTYEALFGK